MDSGDEKTQDTSDVSERRHSSSDPVNLSLGCREREDDSNDGHIDVETIGNAPSKVSLSPHLLFIYFTYVWREPVASLIIDAFSEFDTSTPTRTIPIEAESFISSSGYRNVETTTRS